MADPTAEFLTALDDYDEARLRERVADEANDAALYMELHKVVKAARADLISRFRDDMRTSHAGAMSPSDYQRSAARTLIDGNDRSLTGQPLMAVWNALGLVGEAGEVAETIKKGVLHGHGVDPDVVAKELGDVLWYVAGLATVYGLDLGEIMDANIEKLLTRYPDGFAEADSIARRDVTP